jgi:hypothetical protein
MLLVAVVSIGVWLFSGRSRDKAAMEDLRRESADLRAQLEARDRAIADLQTIVAGLPQRSAVSPRPSGERPQSPFLNAELELARRMADVTSAQSNLLVLVEKLIARAGGSHPPDVAARLNQKALVVFETVANEEQQRLDSAKQRAAELLVGLNVPAEISTMEAGKALDTAGLRAYWPYFEAKRERDALQALVERLRIRLMQERMEAAVEAAKGTLP